MASLLISLLISQCIAARSEEKPDLDLAKPILTAMFTKESTTQNISIGQEIIIFTVKDCFFYSKHIQPFPFSL